MYRVTNAEKVRQARPVRMLIVSSPGRASVVLYTRDLNRTAKEVNRYFKNSPKVVGREPFRRVSFPLGTIPGMDTTPIMHELATRLRIERARNDWTLEQAAAASGVHAVTISRYENAKKLPTLESLYLLAKAYGVEAASLVPPNALGMLPKAKKPKKKE
jgi:ribosome-binding protein aMBF1 (putative translation factor)